MNNHAHHWIIAEANGPTSPGTCHCGETREFSNYIDDATWGNKPLGRNTALPYAERLGRELESWHAKLAQVAW